MRDFQEIVHEATYEQFFWLPHEQQRFEQHLQRAYLALREVKDPLHMQREYEQFKQQFSHHLQWHEDRMVYERALQAAHTMNHDEDVKQAIDWSEQSISEDTPSDTLRLYTELLHQATERAQKQQIIKSTVKDVELAIHAILNPAQLTLHDLHRVIHARESFNALVALDSTIDWEREVVNYDHLLEAERVQQQLLDALNAKEQAIQEANDALRNLPNPLTLKDRDAVNEAERLVKEAVEKHGATAGGEEADIDRRPLDEAQRELERLQREKDEFERNLKAAEDNLERALHEAKVVANAPTVKQETERIPAMKLPSGAWKEEITPEDVNARAEHIRKAAREEARRLLQEALDNTKPFNHVAPFNTLRPEGEQLMQDETTSANRFVEQADALCDAQIAHEAAEPGSD